MDLPIFDFDRKYISEFFHSAGHTILEVIIMGREPRRQKQKYITEKEPVSEIYPVIDTDLARDNIENDIPAADLQDLQSDRYGK